MRRMITQKMIDYIKSLQNGSFTPEDISYIKDLNSLIGLDADEEVVEIDGNLSVSVDAEIGGDASITGDLDVVGNITAKEVKEENDTELIDLSSYVNTGFAKTHSLYAKLLVKHGLLTIVISGQYVAGTDSGSNPSILDNFMEVLPASLKSKIYRGDGTSLDEAPTTSSFKNTAITLGNLAKLVSGVGTSFGSGYALYSANSSQIGLQGYSFGSIAEGTECFISLRITLTI